MKKKLVGLLLSLTLIMTLVTGCAGEGDSSSSDVETSDYSFDYSADDSGFDSSLGSYYTEGNEADLATADASSEESFEETDGTQVAEKKNASQPEQQPTQDETEYDTQRKLIYESNIDIETKKFDDDIDAIKKLVSNSGGYFEQSSINGTAEKGGRDASYTARIPAKDYQSFMESIGGIGSVTYSNEYVNDITSNYVDVQARLKSLYIKLERLQELEQNATTMEDLLAIEDRINEVQYDIENNTAQLKLYDDKVDYCTITINVSEVVTYTEVKKDTAGNRFREAFVSSIAGFMTFVQWFIIAVIYVLPYAVVAGIIVVIILLATKDQRAKRKIEIKRQKAARDAASKNNGYSGPIYANNSQVDTSSDNDSATTVEYTDITNSEK